jgi:hypothetical protein
MVTVTYRGPEAGVWSMAKFLSDEGLSVEFDPPMENRGWGSDGTWTNSGPTTRAAGPTCTTTTVAAMARYWSPFTESERASENWGDGPVSYER